MAESPATREELDDLFAVLRFTRDTFPPATERWIQWAERMAAVERVRDHFYPEESQRTPTDSGS